MKIVLISLYKHRDNIVVLTQVFAFGWANFIATVIKSTILRMSVYLYVAISSAKIDLKQ